MIAIRLPQPDECLRRIELPRDLERLHEVRHFVAGAAMAAGFDEDDSAALELAVVEAMTNVIRHAHGTPVELVIELNAQITPHDLTFSIVYPGHPYTPTTPPTPDFSGQSEGGFGLFIIQQSCDEVAYTHSHGINRTELRKRRTQA